MEWIRLYENSFILFQGLVETLSQTHAACKLEVRKYGAVINLILRVKTRTDKPICRNNVTLCPSRGNTGKKHLVMTEALDHGEKERPRGIREPSYFHLLSPYLPCTFFCPKETESLSQFLYEQSQYIVSYFFIYPLPCYHHLWKMFILCNLFIASPRHLTTLRCPCRV